VTAPPLDTAAAVAEDEAATRQAGTDEDQSAAADPAAGQATRWRRWRLPLALMALIVLAGTAIALLTPAPETNSYLDPASNAADGTKALADILSERGFQVLLAYSPARALADVGSSGSGAPTATLVITSPDLLTSAQRAQLSLADADLLLVGPGSASLAMLAPPVTVANPHAPIGPAQPSCLLTAPRLAGSADVGGITYNTPGDVDGCYPVGGYPALARYITDDRTVTILGTGAPLTNGLLANDGNAALALNLLNTQHRIVWLTPEPAAAYAGPPAGPTAPGPSLIPWAAWLVVLQLCVAALVTALWRARRFGPLITERLPVVVRASETVEGHARLYQSRRARDRAAAALRDAMLRRTRPALGLAPDAPTDAVTNQLASRSRLGSQKIWAIVYGPPPAGDAELVSLARNLDELEREVRSQ